MDLVIVILMDQSPELTFIIKQQKLALLIPQQGMHSTDRDVADPQIALVPAAHPDRLMLCRHNLTQCRTFLGLVTCALQHDVRMIRFLNSDQFVKFILVFDEPRQILLADLTL
jgi:hypothetical protein